MDRLSQSKSRTRSGEYSALAFADAFSFEDGVTLTKERGEAMQAAADETSSGMVSVLGLGYEQVRPLRLILPLSAI